MTWMTTRSKMAWMTTRADDLDDAEQRERQRDVGRMTRKTMRRKTLTRKEENLRSTTYVAFLKEYEGRGRG